MQCVIFLILVSLRVMFYNCENLLLSSGHTYEKMINLTRVLVAAGEGRPPAIIGLAEVENDSIMRRWTTRTPLARWHYRYIITHSPDVRGINVAFMYQPDEFRVLGHNSVRINMPEDLRPTRDLLHAWGRVISGDTVDVVVCHLPSRYGGKKASDKARAIAHDYLRRLMDSICHIRVEPHLVVMGDFNDYPDSRQVRRHFSGYRNLMLPLQNALDRGRLSYGSHKYAGQWGFLDQMIVNESMADTTSGMYVANVSAFVMPFMLVNDEKNLGKRPKRTRYGMVYEGGYSDHLPVVADLMIGR